MTSTIFTVLGLLIGMAIAIAGGKYLKKEWNDKESRIIYSIFVSIGLVITIGFVIKITIVGF